MKATCVTFYEFGSPENVLKVENKSIQQPMNGEVLVRMTLRPINPSDLLPIFGTYSHRISLPSIPGYEGVGVVEEIGPFVSHDLIGRRVLPLRGEGTWQEFVRTSANLAVPIPHSIRDETAAQLYINPLTAWLTCTDVLALKPEDILLVNAGGSAIGRIFAQLSNILGFRLIAATRNNVHTKELLQLGASDVINTSDTSLHSMVMELTEGRGANAAIDSVGGVEGTELAFCLQPDGILLTIGLLSGQPINWAKISKQTKVKVKMFHLRHWNQQVSVEKWQETFDYIFTLLNNKKLRLMIPNSHYALSEVHEAIRFVESSSGNKGKTLLFS